MKIGIISDHRGYHLKKEIIENMKEYNLVDLGANNTDKNTVDYPDYAFLLGKNINEKTVDYGVAICGSGIGICIALNKVKGIRCAKVSSVEEVKETMEHNDPNAISFSADIKLNMAIEFIKTMVETPFSNEVRHKRRVDKIKQYENGDL